MNIKEQEEYENKIKKLKFALKAEREKYKELHKRYERVADELL